MKFKVIFYEKTNDEVPVENFMQSLDVKMKAKLTGLIEILSEYGPQLREPYSKSLGDGIFELRGKVGNNITRVLYFFYYNGIIVLTNGFVKKSMKTPQKEILRAKQYRKDYIERCEKDENI